MKLYLFIFVSFAVAVLSLAQDDNNFEEDAAPAPPASSILARARGRALPGKPVIAPKPVENSKLKKATPAPVVSTPPPNDADPAEEEFIDDQEEGEFIDENVEASSAKPTEPPKRLGQSARPFRSNQDLLESLKRRREQRVISPASTTTTSTQFTPIQKEDKPSKSPGRSKFSSSKGNFSPSQEQVFDNSKKSRNTFRNKVTQPPVPVEEEQDLEATQAPKGRSFGGRSRRL